MFIESYIISTILRESILVHKAQIWSDKALSASGRIVQAIFSLFAIPLGIVDYGRTSHFSPPLSQTKL